MSNYNFSKTNEKEKMSAKKQKLYNEKNKQELQNQKINN